MVLVITYYNQRDVELAFIKAGQNPWTCYTVIDAYFNDAVFYRGQVYAIGYQGSILSFELNDSSEVLDKTERAPPLGLDDDRVSTPESTDGEQIHARRIFDNCSYSSDESDSSSEEVELKTETFMVDITEPLDIKELASPLDSWAYREYLLESTKGELLHVRELRHDVDTSDEDDSSSEEYGEEVPEFIVYKVVFDERDSSIVWHECMIR